jgi:hypothetical protein
LISLPFVSRTPRPEILQNFQTLGAIAMRLPDRLGLHLRVTGLVHAVVPWLGERDKPSRMRFVVPVYALFHARSDTAGEVYHGADVPPVHDSQKFLRGRIERHFLR